MAIPLRLLHYSLRLALVFAVAAQPTCSVYDSALLDEVMSSTAMGGSAGGDFVIGVASGETGEVGGAGEGGDPGSAGQNGIDGSMDAGTTSAAGATGCSATDTAGGGASIGAAGNGGMGGSSGSGGAAGSSNGGGGANAGAAGRGGAGAAGTGGGVSGSGGAPGVDACRRSNWVVSASESSPDMSPPQAIDGDGGTRWSSGAAQVGGEWFRLDLGAVAAHLTQLVLDTTAHPTDFPVNFKLELSVDGSAFTPVATGSGSSITTVKLGDRSARYLKITQTGTSLSWWSIHELSISCQSN